MTSKISKKNDSLNKDINISNIASYWIEKIKSTFILNIIFSFIEDKNFVYKIFNYSKFLQKN